MAIDVCQWRATIGLHNNRGQWISKTYAYRYNPFHEFNLLSFFILKVLRVIILGLSNSLLNFRFVLIVNMHICHSMYELSIISSDNQYDSILITSLSIAHCIAILKALLLLSGDVQLNP